MEGSSSNLSSIVEIREEYPYPSHISTPSLSVKLSDRGKYNVWKTQMIYFLTGHDMLGFINGEFVNPKGNGKAKMQAVEAWIRSDALVVSWILGTLSEEVTMHVVNHLTPKNPNVDFTAKDVWDELECIYGPESIQQAIGSSSNSSFTVEIIEEYPYGPYPSHISTPNLSVKLSDGGKYNVWKTQMIYFLTSHDMLGFIDGKFVSKGNIGKAKMEDTEAWIRSNALVVSWILGTLSEEVSMYVVTGLTTSMNPNVCFTAKDVWDQLERIYGPKILQQATEEDAKSEDKSKEKEETNEDEREKIKKEKEEANEYLYEKIVKGQMPEALRSGEVTVTDKITKNGNTALHVAVGTSKNSKYFEELLEKKPENIPLTDLKNSDGSTLLHIAAIVGNTAATKILVERYPKMLIEKDNESQTPLAIALSSMHTETAKCLLNNIKTDDIHKDLFSGTSGDELLVLAISSKDFQLAQRLLKHYKNLDSDAVLMAIPQNFPRELNFWERRANFNFRKAWAYAFCQYICCARITSTIGLIYALFKLGILTIYYLFQYAIRMCVFPFFKRKVQARDDALNLLSGVCKKISKNYYTNPILEATRQNALNVVTTIVYYFPNAFWSATEDGHNVIQYAMINRSEKIYNLLYEMSEHKNVYKTCKDSSGNNLLHLAARLAPAEKLSLISGAALQIQYELQWYKEVERFVCPLNITQKNSSQETPQMVFTEQHKALVSEGEKWMKSTAKSYTITAALITTVVFAAAITVPGGNNQETGVPIFTNNPAFTIFAVTDAISLFTAVMSLLMFLSILTARFAEEDFLYKLPMKLIIGLVTLFVSTTTMIIAFGAALFIVFGQKNASSLIPIGALTGLTITFFVALQFPLVVDLVSATYGRHMFGRNKAASIFDNVKPFVI